jgi:hypothetical protein
VQIRVITNTFENLTFFSDLSRFSLANLGLIFIVFRINKMDGYDTNYSVKFGDNSHAVQLF